MTLCPRSSSWAEPRLCGCLILYGMKWYIIAKCHCPARSLGVCLLLNNNTWSWTGQQHDKRHYVSRVCWNRPDRFENNVIYDTCCRYLYYTIVLDHLLFFHTWKVFIASNVHGSYNQTSSAKISNFWNNQTK